MNPKPNPDDDTTVEISSGGVTSGPMPIETWNKAVRKIIGGTIKLETRRVEFSGRLVPAIRVVLEDRNTQLKSAPPQAPPAPAPAAEQESDDVPF